MVGKLVFEDGTEIEGESYGFDISVAGEVVFSTGMVGYPESLTDPSYKGQILIMTYPLVGNYGVPDKSYWESDNIKVSGLVVSSYVDTPSHFQSKETLASWFKNEKVPLLAISDTRFLTQKIRSRGAMLGKMVIKGDVPLYDPNTENLVSQVSTKKIIEHPKNSNNTKTILLFDCGAKENIERCLIKRNVNLITVPWDFDPFENSKIKFDAIVISNGPGDPKLADKTIGTVKKAMNRKVPTLGICLGNQILALAAGGDTKKLKFGHRSQNQPCVMLGSERCYITTQNHGFAVSKIPPGFEAWFTNANDGTNEGIKHKNLPFMSVQFHPESTPGPVDTEWIFDYFLEKI
jgi:carbamoyl-phosphate synthase small subunit